MLEKVRPNREYFQLEASDLHDLFVDRSLFRFDQSNGYASGIIIGLLESLSMGRLIKSQPILAHLVENELAENSELVPFVSRLRESGLSEVGRKYSIDLSNAPSRLLRWDSVPGKNEVAFQATTMVSRLMKPDLAATAIKQYLAEIMKGDKTRGDPDFGGYLKNLSNRDGNSCLSIAKYTSQNGFVSKSGDLAVDANFPERPR